MIFRELLRLIREYRAAAEARRPLERQLQADFEQAVRNMRYQSGPAKFTARAKD